LKRGIVLSLAAAALAWACARPGPPRLPEGDDYLFPTPRAGEARTEETRRLESAWRELLAGHTAAAERDYRRLLQRNPQLVPAQTGIAYVRLREGRLQDAASAFASVLAGRPDDVPALIGAASAAVRLGDPEAALGFYRRVQALRPGAVPRGRLADMKLQTAERRVAAGRAALAEGDKERALGEYQAALAAAPEVAGLRLEVAALLTDRSELAEAAAVLAAEPAEDRQVMLRLGEVLVELGDYSGALETYRRLLARDPKDDEAQRRVLAVRDRLALSAMPEEYQRIASAPRITRADLAALVSVKVTALARVGRGNPVVAIDVSGSWAREHILKNLALGIMDVYPNHTFQPAATVRRGDLAQVVGRILNLLNWPPGPTPAIADMSRSHLLYAYTARTVAAGLMDLTPSGAFEPWRPVSGRDAQDVIEGLVRLVGP